MSKHTDPKKKEKQEVWVLTSPQWITTFFAIAVPASLIPFIIGFMAGLSVAHDVVFGFYALLSGVFADFILRSKFNRVLLLLLKPRVPFIIFWLLLSLYVMLFSPLQ